MHVLAVHVRFDSVYLFLDLADGLAFEFPLDCFPLLQAASGAGRTHFAISLDGEQVFWPELDEDMNVTALLASFPDNLRHYKRRLSSPGGRTSGAARPRLPRATAV